MELGLQSVHAFWFAYVCNFYETINIPSLNHPRWKNHFIIYMFIFFRKLYNMRKREKHNTWHIAVSLSWFCICRHMQTRPWTWAKKWAIFIPKVKLLSLAGSCPIMSTSTDGICIHEKKNLRLYNIVGQGSNIIKHARDDINVLMGLLLRF